MTHRISAVFPAFNEEPNIESLVEQCVEALEPHCGDEFEIIIVDDGSSDKTAEEVERMSKKVPQVRLIRHEANRGYAKALRSGFEAAKTPLIFYSDADNQFNLREISLLLPLIEDAHIAVGYRVDRKDTVLRKFCAWGYNTMASFIFGLHVRDIDCAFKLFRRDIFDRIKIESEQFVVDTEILAKAEKMHLTTEESPVSHLPRELGSTTVKPSHIINTLIGIARLKYELAKS